LNPDGQPQDLTASSFFRNNFGPVSRDHPFYIERNSNNQYERTYLPQVKKSNFDLFSYDQASQSCESAREYFKERTN